MKKYILIASLLFSGCSYKAQTFSNTFQKQKEVNRDNCQKPFAYLDDNDITIKQKCLLTYDGVRSETYDTCEFSTPAYIGKSLIAPIAGVISIPFVLIGTLFGAYDGADAIKGSLILITYPISGPFYRPDCKNKKDMTTAFSAYDFNPAKQHYKGEETLKFKDTVKIFPDKEIWIGDKNHQYPLKLNDNLTYYMPNKLIDFFCKDKDSCNLTIYTKDDDKLQKLTTINIK